MFAERKDKKPRADMLLVQDNEIFAVSNLAFAAKIRKSATINAKFADFGHILQENEKKLWHNIYNCL